MKKIAAVTDTEKQTKAAISFASGPGCSRYDYKHPRTGKESSLYSHLTDAVDPITGAEASALWLARAIDPESEAWQETSWMDWARHYELRLAYENQMLAAQGGRLEQEEIQIGGKLGGKLIIKANKSSVTGRCTSVSVLGPRITDRWAYKASNIPGTEWAEYQIDTERLTPDAYTPPTEESLKELEETRKKIKAGAPKKEVCPLINPTDKDAERLQALWNERAKAERDARSDAKYLTAFEPSEVCRITQAQYSEASKGTYARAETREIAHDAELKGSWYNAKTKSPIVCKIRITSGEHAKRVILITDKPQKPLPAQVWEKYEAAELVTA